MPRTRKFSELSEGVRRDAERARRVDDLVAAYPSERSAYRLGELRRALGVTQVELAALIGRSQATVSQIEGGDVALSVDLLNAIVEGLGGTLRIEAIFPDRAVELRL
jgi:DNA-binding XRE family transcriptional regulator